MLKNYPLILYVANLTRWLRRHPVIRDVARVISRIGKKFFTNKNQKNPSSINVDENSEVE